MALSVFDRVRRIVADVFQLEPEAVVEASGPPTIESWDSINHLNLVLALENEFSVSFEPEEVDHLDSVGRIVRALEGKLGPSRPAEATSAPELPVRPLAAGDLGAVTALLSRRDGRDYAPGAVARYLGDLDQRRLMGWIAMAGDRPVGMTALYLREVRWGEEMLRAGYWSHLYVHEEFRKLLVYQRLVHSMLNEAPAAGVNVIYTGTRRSGVAEAHIAIGFHSLGTLGVLVKPLRPFGLLARYRGWKALEWMSPPPDALYRAGLALGRRRPPSRIRVVATDSNSPHLQGLLDLLDRQAGSRVRQRWTAESWRGRFSATLEGMPYTLLVALDGQELLGGLLLRVAERDAPVGGASISLGVVMEVLAPESDAAVATHLLWEAERRALQAGCQAMLWLDGVAELRPLMDRLGYRASSETYRMLVWPPARVPAGSPAERLSNWRFPFSEHDAF
jgi:acyl carrier protein